MKSRDGYGMNGRRFVLDTNAVIQLLQGNAELIALTKMADYLAISVVTRLEFLCFSGLGDQDRQLFDIFSRRIAVIGIAPDDSELLDKIVLLRVEKSLKIPDAIIAASAIKVDACLVTADKRLLASINNVYSYQVNRA